MKKITAQRWLEILPGFLTWATFIAPVILSFVIPQVVSIFLLIYALYWLFRTIIISFHLVSGYRHFLRDIKIDWRAKCDQDFPGIWQKYYHMVLVPTYKEDFSILQSTFNALAESNYPLDKLIVVLATEERDEASVEVARKIDQEFSRKFAYFLTTRHAMTRGETRGKGSNITFAVRQAKQDIIDRHHLPYEDIIVTTLDADHRADKQYFASVTHAYLSTPDPIHKSFQPIPLFFNNIWQAAFPMRLVAMSSSFWQMIEATRPYRLRNFASHSQSFAGLVETDFWSVTSIVEDGHQYWRSFFKFHGNYSVIPIFTPIYQDAILAGDFKTSIKEQYLQKRRWAYGCSDIPYAVLEAYKHKEIPFWEKWSQVWRLIEGHHSWATASIVLATVGWLPIFLNHGYSSTVLAYNFPYYYRYILYSAMTGMVVTLTISSLLVPKPNKNRHISRLRILWEWVLTPIITPVTSILFGSLPAIESQTRLMCGKYLGEFRVTIKKPVNKPETS